MLVLARLALLGALVMLEPAGAEPSYEDVRARLEEATTRASNSSARRVLDELEAALELMATFRAQLHDDPEARAALLSARLNLVRGLQKHEPERAAAIVDEILRTTIGVEIGHSFGPRVDALLDERRAVLDAEGTATLELTCHVECDVAIDTYPVADPTQTLYLGHHSVRVTARDDSIPPLETEVELRAAGEHHPLTFGTPPPPVVDPLPVVEGPKRILPRAAEISGVAAGVGLVVVGAVLAGFDDHCVQKVDVIVACPQIWESSAGAGVSIGLGSALAITAAVLLTLDERKLRRSKEERAVVLGPGGVLHF